MLNSIKKIMNKVVYLMINNLKLKAVLMAFSDGYLLFTYLRKREKT